MKKQQIIPSIAEIFTLSVVFVSVFNLILGSQSAEISQLSELFALCGEGLSLKALGELLLMSIEMGVVKYIWFSDQFFPHMLLSLRITCMLVSVFVLAGVASVEFGWFPWKMWQAWAGFIASFLVSTVLSFSVMMIEGKIESQKYKDALTQYQNSVPKEEPNHDGH